jgi:hypothetical protein
VSEFSVSSEVFLPARRRSGPDGAIAPKPDTTFGNVKADVLGRFVPGYQRGNFVDVTLDSDWPE